MTKKGGRRVQIKRIRFQIKQAVISNQDPLPFLQQLQQVENAPPFKPTPVDFDIDYPHFDQINKSDPRYQTYKLRYLFGPE
jgi:hypothetical protein